MMGLKDQIAEDMKAAMRAKDQDRLKAIRMLQAAIQRREVDERITLDDAEILSVVEKCIKQSRDAVEQFRQGKREDLAAIEEADIAVWSVYLPEQLSEAEVDAAIDAAIQAAGAASMKDMGKVMGQLKSELQGRADMGAVSAKVKQRLAG